MLRVGFQLGLLFCVAIVVHQVAAFDSSMNVNDIIETSEFDRTSETDLEELFQLYKTQFDKVYATPELEAAAFSAFKASVIRVLEHNAEANQGVHSWWAAINQFSDGTAPHTGLLPPTWRSKKNYRTQGRRRSP
jgi:hypothetical protein